MFHDCVSPDPSVAELYIVPAGKLAEVLLKCRDRTQHAVLPVNSAMPDVATISIAELLDNRQFKWVVACVGVGIDLHGAWTTRLPRFGKIILVNDSRPSRKT